MAADRWRRTSMRIGWRPSTPRMFTRHIDGLDGGYSRSTCITCHTVGYDANTNAVNGGFDDVAKQGGLDLPGGADQRQLGGDAP